MPENLGLQVEVGANIKPLTKGLADARKELASTAAAAGKTDSSIGKLGAGLNSFGGAAKSATSSIGGLASSLISGGLITGVALAGAALIELGKRLFDITAAQKRFNEVLDGAKSAYVKAVLEVDKMRDAFDKAKSGVISKESALKLYNSTIGKTIGQTNDLDIAERNFIANAENYIKYTLYKAAAQVALGKAAEAAFKAEVERNQKVNKLGFLQQAFSPAQGNAASLRQSKVNDALKEQATFQKIYNELLAKANAFGFKGIEQQEKEVKVIKTKTAAQEEYVKVLGKVPPGFFGAAATAGDASLTIKPDLTIVPNIKEIIITPEQQQKVLDGFNKLLDAEKLQQVSDSFDALITTTLNDSIANAADLLGESLADFAASGKFSLPNLFGGLMAQLGTQIQQLGKFLITSSGLIKAAKEAFKKLLANPVASAVVGIGLIALGALLKAQAQKQYKGFATGVRNFDGGFATVGERGPERIFLPTGSSVQPNNEMQAYGGSGREVFIPAVTLSGSDLVLSFNRASAQMSRNG